MLNVASHDIVNHRLAINVVIAMGSDPKIEYAIYHTRGIKLVSGFRQRELPLATFDDPICATVAFDYELLHGACTSQKLHSSFKTHIPKEADGWGSGGILAELTKKRVAVLNASKALSCRGYLMGRRIKMLRPIFEGCVSLEAVCDFLKGGGPDWIHVDAETGAVGGTP